MILVCGEALIDLFVETADAARGPAPGRGGLPALAVAGGSPFNLAVGLARLGAGCGFLGGLSEDAFGRMLARRLAEEGVDLRLARTSARPTPLAIVGTDAAGRPAYTFHVEGCAHADVTPADLPASLDDAVAAIAVGSFSLAMEPVGATLAGLVARESRRRVVSLDPNLRPDLIRDPSAFRARVEALVRHAAIVKMSDEDLAALHGADADADTLARGWLAEGVQLVVVTAGPAGATAWHGSGRRSVPGRPVRVVDTVGAGDTFHAALLAGLARAGRLSRAGLAALDAGALDALLAEAATAASLTCARLGADLPTLAELRAA